MSVSAMQHPNPSASVSKIRRGHPLGDGHRTTADLHLGVARLNPVGLFEARRGKLGREAR